MSSVGELFRSTWEIRREVPLKPTGTEDHRLLVKAHALPAMIDTVH